MTTQIITSYVKDSSLETKPGKKYVIAQKRFHKDVRGIRMDARLGIVDTLYQDPQNIQNWATWQEVREIHARGIRGSTDWKEKTMATIQEHSRGQTDLRRKHPEMKLCL